MPTRRGGWGAKFFVGAQVIGFRFAGDRVTGVQTSAGRFCAARVVNCAGPWASGVAQWAGVTLPIRSCRAQVAVFRRPAGLEGAHPVIIDFVHAAYFRPATGFLTLAGLVDPAEADAVVDPADDLERADQEFISRLTERIVRRYPPMELGQGRGRLRWAVSLRVDYPLALKKSAAGEVNPATQQLDFYIRSPEADPANNPTRKVFHHFFALEVTWK